MRRLAWWQWGSFSRKGKNEYKAKDGMTKMTKQKDSTNERVNAKAGGILTAILVIVSF